MQLLLKLMLLAVMGCVMQVAMQSVMVVERFPLGWPGGVFDDQTAISYHNAQHTFQKCNGLTRWVIVNVWFDPSVATD